MTVHLPDAVQNGHGDAGHDEIVAPDAPSPLEHNNARHWKAGERARAAMSYDANPLNSHWFLFKHSM